MTKIHDLFNGALPTVSFEFFPPKDDASLSQFNGAIHDLALLRPDFVSVTYGAAGSDRDRTRDTVIRADAEFGFPVMAHLTCVGHTRREIAVLVDSYEKAGVQNILALGGDAPKSGPAPRGDFRHASDLVAYLRDNYDLSIGVAAHPEGHPRSADLHSDRRNLAKKLNEADFAITQFFFDVDHYRSMIDDLGRHGCTKPVVPGIIPITNAAQVTRFAEMAGATIPAELLQRIEAANGDEAEVRKIGVAAAAKLASDLLDAGAPGLHLYSLNRPEASTEVLAELGLVPAAAL